MSNQHPTKRQRNAHQYVGIALRGALMGAADAVPGVSGGTIAFMTGIYEELIGSLKNCNPVAVKLIFSDGIKAAWHYINGNFLVALFAGVILSLASVARGVIYLLEHYPILLWSFFFGLILAAVWSLVRHISGWNLKLVSSFVFGAIAAYLITTISPTQIETSPLIVFTSGMIAICAMILPGISGSFLLLLLGMYAPMMLAIKELQLATLSIFAAGCIIGLLSFSHVLSWMFNHHKGLTLSLLGGFMLGSLNKVWPWKHTVETTINRHGEIIPLVQNQVLPAAFEQLTGQDAYTWFAVGLCLVGILLVAVMDKVSQKNAS